MYRYADDNPLKKKYIQLLRIFLLPLGAWPGLIVGEDVPLCLVILKYFWSTWAIIMSVSQIYFIVNYVGTMSLYLCGDVVLGLSLTIVFMVYNCLPHFKAYSTIFAKYIQKIHLVHFREKQGFYEQIYKKVEVASDLSTKLTIPLVICGFVLFDLVPIYNNYKKGFADGNVTLEFSLYWQLPGIQQERFYNVAIFINVIESYVCSFTIIAINHMMMLMIFQIIGHIKILEYNLRNLQYVDSTEVPHGSLDANFCSKDVTCNMFDHDTNKRINQQLKSCADHHRLIVSFVDELSNFYGTVLAVLYLFDLFGCCLVLLECSQGDPKALARFGTLATIIFALLIQISVLFEILLSASEKLSSAMYSTPWERMNVPNRRLVHIMLLRMQTPIKVTAMGMVDVGVLTMTAILKTTFSYFMFLRSKSE